MIWTVKDLYEGFIAETGKFNIDGEIGRASFQDFEIEHFLNSAYRKVLTQKITSYDNLWLPIESRKGSMGMVGELSQKQEDPGVIANDSQLLSEFGTLVKPYWEFEASYHMATKSSNKMMYFNHPFDASGNNIPLRLMTAHMTYCLDAPTEDGGLVPFTNWAPDTSRDNGYWTGSGDSAKWHAASRTYSCYLLRPMTAVDTVKNSHLFYDSTDLPYRYYSVSTRLYWKYGATAPDPTPPNPPYLAPTLGTFVEVLSTGGQKSVPGARGYYWIHGYGLSQPKKLTLQTPPSPKLPNLSYLTDRIEVLWGEEIILAAAAMADNAIKKKIQPD